MPPVPVIIIIAVLFAGSFAYMFYMNKKRKDAQGKYDSPEMYKQAPQLLDELLAGRFAAIRQQMQGAPVDAFTQCAYIASVSDKAKSAAATAAKTVAWAAVGVKARYNEADHAAYLVLSGDDLHYFFFEEGAAKTHLVFDRYRMMSATVGTVSGAEKVTRMGSVMGRKNHKLRIDIDGKPVDLIYYERVERYPDSVLTLEKNVMDSMGKLKLMGTYFMDQFHTRYPHLNSNTAIASA